MAVLLSWKWTFIISRDGTCLASFFPTILFTCMRWYKRKKKCMYYIGCTCYSVVVKYNSGFLSSDSIYVFEEFYIFLLFFSVYVCIDAAAELKKQLNIYEKRGLFQRRRKRLILGGRIKASWFYNVLMKW